MFGATAPPVTAFKWAFGHPLPASGILDSVLALVALRHGVVPGVATLRELDPDLGKSRSQRSTMMADGTSPLTRCGIDTVEIARSRPKPTTTVARGLRPRAPSSARKGTG